MMENKKAVALSGICCGKLGVIVAKSKLKEYDWRLKFKFQNNIEYWDYKTSELEIIDFL